MSTASIRDLLLALGHSLRNDADRNARLSTTQPTRLWSLCNSSRNASSATSSINSCAGGNGDNATPANKLQLLRNAYGVLLQGAPAKNSAEADDVIEELRFVQFELAHKDVERSEELGTCIADLMRQQQNTADDGTSERDAVLRLLLHLRDTVQPPAATTPQSQIFAKLNAFDRTSPNCYTNVLHRYLDGLRPNADGSASRTPHLPSIFDVHMLCNDPHSSNPYTMRSCASGNDAKAVTPPRNRQHIDARTTATVAKRTSAQLHSTQQMHIKGHSWDYVSAPLDRHRIELKFASESGQSLPYLLQQHQGDDVAIAASVVGRKQLSSVALVEAIKLLLVGTPSATFTFDGDLMRFDVVPDVCVQDGTAQTTAAICAPFVECGTCCARLRLMCDRDGDFGLRFKGFVFRTVCLSVEDYLDVFRKFVEEFDDLCVLQLANRMAPLMRQIGQLCKMFDIHPEVTPSLLQQQQLPHGASFLDHLHRAIVDFNQSPDVAHLFTYILQRCCRVYYRHFELWLFHGRIDDNDDSGELFVQYTDCGWPHSKHFWDNAFRVCPTNVPHFLHGIEQATLLCGKYTMLLKAIRPEHALLRIEPLRLRVCLSDSDVAAMQTACREYASRTQLVCGAPIRIRAVHEQQRAERHECVRRASERFAENMARWRAEQAQQAGARREEHGRRRAVLEAQIEELHDRRVLQRAQTLREDREFLRQAELVEEQRAQRERADRERRIGYYEELGELVEKRRTEADAVVQDLRVQLTEAKQLTAKMSACLVGSEEVAPPAEDGMSIETDGNRNEVTAAAAVRNATRGPCSDKLESDANANPSQSADETPQVDAARNNKAMVLGTTFDFYYQSTATAKKCTELLRVSEAAISNCTPPSTDANSNPCDGQLSIASTTTTTSPSNSTAHREMQENRARVMGQKYDLIGHTTETPTPRALLRSASDAESEMTDLQRNRRRVMTEEYATLMGGPRMTVAASVSLTLPLKTLDSGHDRLNVPNALETPMSTSSDTPAKRFEDGIVGEAASATTGDVDEQAGKNMSLKLDVTRAFELQQKVPSAVTSVMYTALTGPTNTKLAQVSSGSSVYETASSTLHADVGFDFTVKSMPKKTHTFEYPKTLQDADATQSEDTLSWLFSCADRDKTASHPNGDASSVDDAAAAEADISTLTDRLRASFAMPLHTHLAILSNEVLKVFVLDLQALDHFKSLRNYFFMMDGEFASHICDGLFVKLEQQKLQPSEMLNFACLHALLDGALGSSIIGNDPNAERLSFRVDATADDTFELRSPHVLHMLTLTYAVDWPLNLLLSPAAIEHYGRIFQHLLALRRCRYVLDEVSQLLKAVAKQRPAGGGSARGAASLCVRSPQFGRVQQVRNRLLQFVNALQNHVTSSALQASWRQFKVELETARSLEDCYQMHKRYLKRVEFLCMLNRSSAKFYVALEMVMKLTLRFYHKLKSHEWQFDPQSAVYTHPAFKSLAIVEAEFDKLVPYVVHMGEKIARRGYQAEIGDLISLINFNGYYDVKQRK